MDIRCPKCGEPWDHDELHEEAQSRGTDYTTVMREFQSVGCEAFGCSHGHVDDDAAMLASMTYDLMGDDMDGAASMFDDAEYFGIL